MKRKSTKKYYCIEKNCNNEISLWNYKYGQKKCRSCASKKKYKDNPQTGNYIDNRINIKHYCKDCPKEISYSSWFVGQGRCHSCAAKYQIKIFGAPFKDKHHTETTKRKISKIHKNKIVTEETRRKMRENHADVYGKKCHFYIHGKSKEPYPLGFNNKLRAKIRKRDNYICQLCGVKQEDYYRKLDVHHIDYDKENLKPENLISLCDGCNSKVNSNIDYWFAYFSYIMEDKNV